MLQILDADMGWQTLQLVQLGIYSILSLSPCHNHVRLSAYQKCCKANSSPQSLLLRTEVMGLLTSIAMMLTRWASSRDLKRTLSSMRRIASEWCDNLLFARAHRERCCVFSLWQLCYFFQEHRALHGWDYRVPWGGIDEKRSMIWPFRACYCRNLSWSLLTIWISAYGRRTQKHPSGLSGTWSCCWNRWERSRGISHIEQSGSWHVAAHQCQAPSL